MRDRDGRVRARGHDRRLRGRVTVLVDSTRVVSTTAASTGAATGWTVGLDDGDRAGRRFRRDFGDLGGLVSIRRRRDSGLAGASLASAATAALSSFEVLSADALAG